MATVSIDLEIEIGTPSGHVITGDHFGSGFVAREDILDDEENGIDGTFNDVFNQFDIPVLRYPGGTPSESTFDITDPNATTATNMFTENTTQYVPLNQFMEFCDDNGVAPIIVIPTFRFFDQESRTLTENAATDISKFVTDLANGDYGDVDIHAIEIGNEWFSENLFSENSDGVPEMVWTPAEFGALQRDIAEIVHNALEFVQTNSPIPVWAQAGSGGLDRDGNEIADDIEIAGAFSNDDLEFIDGITVHFYAAPRFDNPLDLDDIVRNQITKHRLNWDIGDDGTLEIAVTEWNVGGNEDNHNISGMERMSALTHMFVEMVEYGVDTANIYTVQAPGEGPNALSDMEGGGTPLTPTGLLFQLFNEKLIGKSLTSDVDAPIFSGPDGSGGQQDLGYSYTFEGGGKRVIVLASGVADEIDMDADVTAYLTGATSFAGFEVSAIFAEGDTEMDPTDWNVDAQRLTHDSADLEGSVTDGIFELHMPAYSLLVIEFLYGETIVGTSLSGQTDVLTGAEFHDLITGGAGNDEILGLAGEDTIKGKAGNDTIHGGDDGDTILGGTGDDIINGNDGADTIDGGDGNDTINGGSGDDTLSGGSGSNSGNDIIFGNDGEDNIKGKDGDDMLYGSAGDDILYGNDGDDILSGGDGDDLLDGGDGIDTIYGRNDNDTIYGGAGNDTLNGDTGADNLFGNADNDKIYGNDGRDNLFGGNGDDTLYGGEDEDELSGGNGDDILNGGNGNDTLRGDNNDDTLSGDDGADILYGGKGLDDINGDNGHDTLYGDDGADTLDGGSGNDSLTGGAGKDELTGGAGDDTFVFQDDFGKDTITDFDISSLHETIHLDAIPAITDFADLQANHLIQIGADAFIDDGDGNTILILNVDMDNLTASDFEF